MRFVDAWCCSPLPLIIVLNHLHFFELATTTNILLVEGSCIDLVFDFFFKTCLVPMLLIKTESDNQFLYVRMDVSA